MEKIWFIADSHFSHKNVIDYCNRPFCSVEEMNSALIYNWNKIVTEYLCWETSRFVVKIKLLKLAKN